MQLRLRDQKENLVYLLLWLVLFLAPAVSMFIRSSADGELSDFDWAELLHLWKVYAVYFAIFLVHNFVLAPLLVYKNRNRLYLATTACLVAVVMLFNCMNKPEPFHDGMEAPDFEPGGPRPPKEVSEGRPRPNPAIPFGPADAVNTVFLILLLGMNIGVKLFFKSDRDKQELQQLQQKTLEQQLEYLKYQINPHFFMNTLNNIHALVDIEPEQAKTTIVDLSRLMRYVLYEGSDQLVPLGRDIEFLRNYIKLMRLRYSDRVKISVDIPDAIPDYLIPPMLLITFVENAFKHGVSYQQESFVSIEIRVAGQRMYFGCRNSKPTTSATSTASATSASASSTTATPHEGGVGLANVRQRLDLLFADDYQLDISDSDDSYAVSLDLPLATRT